MAVRVTVWATKPSSARKVVGTLVATVTWSSLVVLWGCWTVTQVGALGQAAWLVKPLRDASTSAAFVASAKSPGR